MSEPSVLDRLFAHTQKKRIPLICTFELTKACNLRCRHCYIPECERRQNLLSTRQVIRILDELAEMGTLYMVFTGGELFLRKDILTLCKAARERHFDLRLFTNGTLITPHHVRCLAAIGVSAVEISIYGTARTHDGITGTKGSWAASIQAVTLLKNAGIEVVLKMPLMTANVGDERYVKTIAKKLKAKLKLDAIITPMSDGNKSPLSLRLPQKIMRRIFKSRTSAALHTDAQNDSKNLLCSAGRNMLAVTADGTITPCIQLPLPLGNARKDPIHSLWHKNNPPLHKFLAINGSRIRTCSTCTMASFCQRCPGLALLEDGSLHGPSSTACLISSIKK